MHICAILHTVRSSCKGKKCSCRKLVAHEKSGPVSQRVDFGIRPHSGLQNEAVTHETAIDQLTSENFFRK